MKIKQLSEEENQEIIDLIGNRYKVTRDAHKLFVTVLQDEYKQYLDNFKPSWHKLFMNNALTYEQFQSEVLGKHGERSIARHESVTKFTDGKFEYFEVYGYGNKKLLQSPAAKKLLELVEYSYNRVLFVDNHIRKMMDFAEQPFTFNDEDIDKIYEYKRHHAHISDELKEIVELLKGAKK